MNDYQKDDEIITVRLPRSEYETLRRVLKREGAYTWFVNSLKSTWVWVVAGGVLSVVSFWDRIILMINGTVK